MVGCPGPAGAGDGRLARVDDVTELLAANRSFYDAFERGDVDSLFDAWERSERAVCTHPGWGSLRGWGRIAASFFALLQPGSSLQFILTSEHPEVVGEVGWVSLEENLLGDQGGTTISTLNVFVRDRHSRRWVMVAHHGSPVMASFPPVPGTAS